MFSVLINRREFVMEPLAFSIPQACEASCSGRTKIYEAINAGELIARKRGKRTLILAEDLQRWVKSLPQMKVKHTEEGGVHADAGAHENHAQESKGTDRMRRAA
jgi:hypothetical protein